MDRLAALLQRFSVSARLFHAGALCGINDFTPERGWGQLHLIRRGPLRVEHRDGSAFEIERPSLLFYPRPTWHRFISDAQVGSDMACAEVELQDGERNPLAAALPGPVCLALDDLAGAEGVIEALFEEAFGQQCGRQSIVDRLFEVVLIKLLRQQLNTAAVDVGLLAGLAHPQLARTLVAVHARPEHPWSLQAMAAEAGMSRSAFAELFRQRLGCTAGDYLNQWRLGLTQQLLLRDQPLKQIVDRVGYAGTAQLSRAFKSRFGCSPREWKQKQTRAAELPA